MCRQEPEEAVVNDLPGRVLRPQSPTVAMTLHPQLLSVRESRPSQSFTAQTMRATPNDKSNREKPNDERKLNTVNCNKKTELGMSATRKDVCIPRSLVRTPSLFRDRMHLTKTTLFIRIFYSVAICRTVPLLGTKGFSVASRRITKRTLPPCCNKERLL